MDSWYLLHILLNVGRVAAMGYEDAAKVFLASVDYAVKGTHRLKYRWPVFYDTRTFKVLKVEIAPGKGGERDIPGLYTHVMLQAWELSNDSKYLREAECAAQYLKGEGFNLLYQTNNTIFSAIAAGFASPMLSRVSGCGIARTDQRKDTTRSSGSARCTKRATSRPMRNQNPSPHASLICRRRGTRPRRRSAISWRNL